MKCQKCQSENYETRKFCRKCGEKLRPFCPKCLFENFPEDMYCGGCGARVGKRPGARGSAQADGKITRALPKIHKFREEAFYEAERAYLKDLLAITERNIDNACHISGLSQSRLYALLKKWKL